MMIPHAPTSIRLQLASPKPSAMELWGGASAADAQLSHAFAGTRGAHATLSVGPVLSWELWPAANYQPSKQTRLRCEVCGGADANARYDESAWATSNWPPRLAHPWFANARPTALALYCGTSSLLHCACWPIHLLGLLASMRQRVLVCGPAWAQRERASRRPHNLLRTLRVGDLLESYRGPRLAPALWDSLSVRACSRSRRALMARSWHLGALAREPARACGAGRGILPQAQQATSGRGSLAREWHDPTWMISRCCRCCPPESAPVAVPLWGRMVSPTSTRSMNASCTRKPSDRRPAAAHAPQVIMRTKSACAEACDALWIMGHRARPALGPEGPRSRV